MKPFPYSGAVVITGTSTGIGQACALALDKLGFSVIAGVRNGAHGDALRQKASGRLRALLLDVTDAGAVSRAAESVASEVGERGLAGLVNNAGIVVAGPLEFLPLAEFRRQLEVNVTGQVQVIQAFLPLLRSAKGRIVNIGSIAGRSATPFMGAYAASKFALEGLSDSLRMELRPWGITVSIVEPGAVATPIWEKSRARAEELASEMPAAGRHLYGRAIDALREASRKAAARAIPPERVVNAVVHALTARKPRTRYAVGLDARLRIAFNHLPDRARDAIITRALGLPKDP